MAEAPGHMAGMTQQQPETAAPDEVADEKTRRTAEERQAVADGDAAPQPDELDDAARDESSYTTEGEQGAAQPAPR